MNPEPNLHRREWLAGAGLGLAASWLSPGLEWLHPTFGDAKLAIALIGAGRQGRAILGELSTIEACEVVAVCDNDATRLDAALRRAAGAKGYADAAAMLEAEPRISAVVIATPTHQHRELVLAALAKQKHVYCEAPLAHSIDDLTAISAAARASKTVFASGFQGRSNPVYLLARSFFKAGTLRELACLRAQNHRKTSWRIAGSTPEREAALNWHLDPALSLGLLGEWGTQQFDVFHHFLGREPRRVRAGGEIRLHADGRRVHDTVQAQFLYEDGLRQDYSATLANSFEGQHEVIAGAMGAIKLAWTHGWMFKEADAPTQGWEVYANRQQFHNERGITLIADATKLAAQGKLQEGVGLPYTSLYYALANFVTAASGGASVACGASEGARTTAVGIFAQRALLEGVEVEIDPKLLESL